MKRYYLVDCENVCYWGLRGIESLTDEDTVVLFVSSACGNMERYLRDIRNLKCTVLKMDVMNGFKNALDFQLVSYLGLLIGEHSGEKYEYNIVSKDKGYLASITMLNHCGKLGIHLIPSITSEIQEEVVLKALTKYFKKYKTCNTIYSIMKDSENVEEARRRIFDKYNNNVDKCEEALTLHFGAIARVDKETMVKRELRKNFKKIKTCEDILKIFKLTDDIGLVCDMVETKLEGCHDWYQRIEKAINLYYGV
jgi:predicted nucleic acid-binding protein